MVRRTSFAVIALCCLGSSARAEDAAVARGHYLAQAGDCTACHTTPGGAPFAGGLPIRTPFGNLVPNNITPDRDTGIGSWTTEQFVQAIRHGIGAHGEHLYAAMPFNDYVKVTDKDVRDIKAYLDTVMPVHRVVVSNQLPFPFDIRLSLIAWNLLYFRDSPFKPEAGKSAEWNRGAYLVQGLGHCAACHTPKTLLGGDRSDAYLQGSPIEGWYAPALDSDPRTGLGHWSVADVVSYLKTGSNQHAVAAGPMAEAVADSTQYMSTNDLTAIAIYLKDLPAPAGVLTAALPTHQAQMVVGAAIFADNCAACHAARGTGINGMVPALNSNPSLLSTDSSSLLHVLLEGGKGAATAGNPTGAGMPAFAWKLNDSEIAAVGTYVRNSWGNIATALSPAQVGKARASLHAVPALSSSGILGSTGG